MRTIIGGLVFLAALGLAAPPALAERAPAGGEAAVPGVTATEIQVGAISTLTGPIASDFDSLVPGVEAYFDYVDARGGIDGRRLVMAHSLDDGGNPSQFNQLADTLIDQDRVFAVVGVATAFFSPNVFLESGTPTYGYAVEDNWSPGPNLYAAGGSVQDYRSPEAGVDWFVKQVHGTDVGLVALGVAASEDACSAFAEGLRADHIKVGYTDLSVQYGGNLAPDVQRMQAAGVNTIISCLDVTDNISMARAIHEYGFRGVKSLWLNGDDRSTVDQYQSLMQNVWFSTAHVPFAYATMAPTRYPGLVTYVKAMERYEPKWVYDEVAIQGWESAALFAEGVRLAGKDLTQARVVSLTNRLTDFTAGGLTANVNWTEAHDPKKVSPPFCAAWVEVRGDRILPALDQDDQSFHCFGWSLTDPRPEKAPAGTPGA